MALEDPCFLLLKFVGIMTVWGFFQISSEKVPYNAIEYSILPVLSHAVDLGY